MFKGVDSNPQSCRKYGSRARPTDTGIDSKWSLPANTYALSPIIYKSMQGARANGRAFWAID